MRSNQQLMVIAQRVVFVQSLRIEERLAQCKEGLID